MEAIAKVRNIRVTPMKARRVVNLIRGKQASEALGILKFAPQAASEPVYKLVEAAVANAKVKADAEMVVEHAGLKSVDMLVAVIAEYLLDLEEEERRILAGCLLELTEYASAFSEPEVERIAYEIREADRDEDGDFVFSFYDPIGDD